MGFKQILNLTRTEAEAGILISDIPGDGGAGPSTAEIFVVAHNLPPSNPGIVMTVFPGFVFASGSDSQGVLGTDNVYINSGNDKDFAYSGGAWPFNGGFWANPVVATINNTDALFDITIIWDGPDVDTYTQSLLETPYNLAITSQTTDPERDLGNLSFTFSYDNTLNEDPLSFVVKRNGAAVGSVLWVDGTTNYSFSDVIENPDGDYVYTIAAYKYSPDLAKSADSDSVTAEFGGDTPDIDITGSGGVTITGSATLVFVADASGIYTLVANKSNDTLYERTSGETIDVKIPDPFIKTGFVGG